MPSACRARGSQAQDPGAGSRGGECAAGSLGMESGQEQSLTGGRANPQADFVTGGDGR